MEAMNERQTGGWAAMTGPDTVVSAAGLAKRYGDVVALRSLDLEVPRNSIFGFLGPNGSGKTTAMRLLLGLAAPTGGRATVLGLDVVRESVAIRRRVGYLPQAPRFYDDLTPRQTLRYARGSVLEIMRRLKETTTVFYSTHILDDVQRVSDTVAILNDGERVAQAPIERLLAGSGGAAYDVTVRGDAEAVRRRLLAQPWVEEARVLPLDGVADVRVGVTDERAAEQDLLRVVLVDPAVEVVRFGQARSQLEDVFVELVEAGAP